MRVSSILLAAVAVGAAGGLSLSAVERWSQAAPVPRPIKAKGPKFIIGSPPKDESDGDGGWAQAGRPAAAPAAAPPRAAQSHVQYAGCREVEAAGKAPLHAGEPGYREDMDGDGDGVACEDYGSGQ